MLVVGLDIAAKAERYKRSNYNRATHIVIKLYCLNTDLKEPKLCTLSPKRTMVFENGRFVCDGLGNNYFVMTGVDDSLIPLYNVSFQNTVYVWKKYIANNQVIGYDVIIRGKFLTVRPQDLFVLQGKGFKFANIDIQQGYVKERNKLLVQQVAQPAQEQVKPQQVQVATQQVQTKPQQVQTKPQQVQVAQVSKPIQQSNTVKSVLTQPKQPVQTIPPKQSIQPSLSNQTKQVPIQSKQAVIMQVPRPKIYNDVDLGYALDEARSFSDWDEFYDRLLSKAQQRGEPLPDNTYFKIEEDISRLYELSYIGDEEEDFSDISSYMFTVHPIFDKNTPAVLELKVPSDIGATQIEIGRCVHREGAKPVEIKTNIPSISEYAFVPDNFRTYPTNEYLTKLTLSFTNTRCDIGSWAFYGCINLQSVIIYTKNINLQRYAIAGSGVKEVLIKAYLPKIWNTNIKWGEGIFADCKMLDTIQIDGVLPNIPKMLCYNSNIKQFIFGMLSEGKREFSVKSTSGKMVNMQTINVDKTAFNSERIVVPCIIDGFKQFNNMFVVQ